MRCGRERERESLSVLARAAAQIDIWVSESQRRERRERARERERERERERDRERQDFHVTTIRKQHRSSLSQPAQASLSCSLRLCLVRLLARSFTLPI
jgi:recombinational DNA repair ATPase RecF